MTMSRAPQQVGPDLPRLVEQLRILLWMQMHLTLVGLLIVTIWIGYLTNERGLHLDASASTRVMVTIATLIAIAAALAVSAKLLWRQWTWVYVLILVTEAAVVANIVRAFASGLAGALLVLLYAALTGWIVANLCRREVRAFLLHP